MDNASEQWSVWVDEVEKIVSTKEIQNGKEIKFESKECGMDVINKLVLKGFKVG